MRLKLQTDYGLRVLIFLAHADRLATVEEIATAFGISRHHLLKVANALSRQGWIQTVRGRGGGILLKADPAILDVGDVVGRLEGRNGVLECVEAPDVCRLEPGCRLRRRLMVAERAFYDALHGTTLADLVRRPGADHGLTTLVDGSSAN